MCRFVLGFNVNRGHQRMEKQLEGKLYTTLRFSIVTGLLILSALGGMALYHVIFPPSLLTTERPARILHPQQQHGTGRGRRFENTERAARAKIEYVTPLLPMNERVSLCLGNPTRCPMFPDSQLESDWPLRHAKKTHAACYFEFKNMNPSCPKACDDIFLLNAHNPELSSHVAQACKIGCSYAAQAQQDAKETCVFNCKNTVWTYDKNHVRCNRQNGLDLELPISSSLTIGKACEFGCILGNERSCPWCDEQAKAVQHETYV